MHIEFRANASDLHRACVRLAGRLPQAKEESGKSTHFRIRHGELGITVEGASANLLADVQRAGAASVPFTVMAGVVHILPYFGKKSVEIGLSQGKMRVDTTVFHNRNIVLSIPTTTQRAPSSF